MKRDQGAYLRDYYQKNRTEIRRKQRHGYEAKYERVSKELLRHLQEHPTHGLGRAEIICPDCERLGPFSAAVCLECGRMALAQLSIHLREAHEMSREDYLEKWGLNRGTSLTSAEFRAKKARPGNLRGGKPFTVAAARRMNIGRTHTLRPEAIARRGSERAVPEKFQSTIRLWPIVKRCLKGRERRQIALELDLWGNSVNRCCRSVHFPSRPARFWRGEPFGDRQLHDLMRDFNLHEVRIAELAKLPVHRIRKALSQKRKGKPLQIDVANCVLRLRRLLRREKRERSTSRIGGRPPKLMTSEVREIPWKFRALLKEVTALNAELPDTVSKITVDRMGELLCQLARKKKASLLLFWAWPFLTWLKREHGLTREALFPPATAVRGFLAWQYQVSEETIGRLLAKRPVDVTDRQDRKRRELLVDMRTLIGGRPRIATEELLAGLPRLRWRWEKLNAYSLAALLRPLEVKPLEWRDGSRVVRGYRREDMGVHSAGEAAREFGITLQGLKKWISLGKIPIPPTVSRAGVRGRGSVRLWTRADIQAAKSVISAQPRTVFRPPASATAVHRTDAV
jgi:hypothetical protein